MEGFMPLQSPFARQVLFFQFLMDFVDHTFVHFLPPRIFVSALPKRLCIASG
jgi:hypothetical protein